MSCFFLLHDNLVPKYNKSFLVNSIEFTSSQAPTNVGIYSSNIRNRPWRTAGFFKVESGSNTLIFRESVGVDLTATITAGEYTTRALYLAAVKTALDAAGASTYTVSIDATTNLTKIVSNGAGGGGIFQLRLTDSLSAVQAGFLGFDTSANLTGGLTYYADDISIHQYEAMTIDLGLASNPKVFLMVGPSNGQIKLSDQVVVTLQGNHTTNWNTPQYESVIPYHPTAMMVFNENGLHTEELRYWRVLIEDPTNPAGYLDIYPIYLGDMYAPDRGAVQFPFSQDVLNFSKDIELDSGNKFGTIANNGQTFEANYSGLTKIEVEQLVEIYKTFGRALPLFMIADANAVYSSEAEYMARMVRFSADPSYTLVSPNNFDMTLAMVEEI